MGTKEGQVFWDSVNTEYKKYFNRNFDELREEFDKILENE